MHLSLTSPKPGHARRNSGYFGLTHGLVLEQTWIPGNFLEDIAAKIDDYAMARLNR